jgi:glycosyltransferase involved in cell wall biosynthesis
MLVVTKLARSFAARNTDVFVLAQTGSRAFARDVTDEVLSSAFPFLPSAGTARTSARSSIRSLLVKVLGHQRLRPFDFLRSQLWGRSAEARVQKLIGCGKKTVILSRDSLGHIPALRLAPRLKIPWIADWSDPYPGERYPPPYGGGPTARISPTHQRLLEDVAHHADWITFPSERLREYMLSYLPAEVEHKSSVIPHGPALLMPGLSPPQGETFVITHAGSLHPTRSPIPFLTALAAWVANLGPSPRVRFDIVGHAHPMVAETVHDLGLDGIVRFVGTLPYGECLHRMAASHVLVLIEAPVREGIFLPSKFVDYVQIGRPILAVSPREGTIADIMNANGGGLVADCTDPGTIRHALETLYQGFSQGNLESEYGSRHLSELFSESVILDAYQRIFARIGAPTTLARDADRSARAEAEASEGCLRTD